MNIDIALYKSIADERIERLKRLTFGNETFDCPKRISFKEKKLRRKKSGVTDKAMTTK